MLTSLAYVSARRKLRLASIGVLYGFEDAFIFQSKLAKDSGHCALFASKS
jgi:hypothetical protein